MAMLLGEYYHQLDAKNRMRIPAKLRKELGDEFYFARGIDGCLFVYPKEELQEILAIIKAIPIGDPRQKNAREFLRKVTSVKEDDQGRLLLSPEMREFIGLEEGEKEIVTCGAGNRVEIWSKASHDRYYGDSEQSYDDLIKGIGF